MKAARDKEQLQTELDVVKDRWEKAHMIHQKLQVPILSQILITDLNVTQLNFIHNPSLYIT